MTQGVEHGTGGRARLPDRQVAGKTGTTQAARDAWFVGFTADYVVGVWMGYDDNKPLTGVTGGGIPAEIWHEVMVRVNEGVPPKPLPLIVPEPKQPPLPGTEPQPLPPGTVTGPGAGGIDTDGDGIADAWPVDPNDPNAALARPRGVPQGEPVQPQRNRQQEDPVESLLKDLLGIN